MEKFIEMEEALEQMRNNFSSLEAEKGKVEEELRSKLEENALLREQNHTLTVQEASLQEAISKLEPSIQQESAEVFPSSNEKSEEMERWNHQLKEALAESERCRSDLEAMRAEKDAIVVCNHEPFDEFCVVFGFVN